MQHDGVIVGADPVGWDPAGRWGPTELSGYVRAIRLKIAVFACKQGTEGFSFWLLDSIIVQHPKAAHSLFAGRQTWEIAKHAKTI